MAQLIPPARVDLVDEVLVGVGRRDLSGTLDWPPIRLVHQLACRVKRVHCGELRMAGPNGEVVEVIRYRDKLGHDRRCYRLTRHGVFVREYTTPEELGTVVDLAELVEEDPGPARHRAPLCPPASAAAPAATPPWRARQAATPPAD